ncbi:HAD hydrolase-like protein [Kineococcus sp. TRM81007]|uniref:HAD family hydrolase n=1 Tax=Kineococcus sp. TRM81007 TaxID=2925831 RepID=UPI001F567FC7|nr:HAD family hydrolase [Kineococcus sp. TRM81007]MCI2239605.1 HAD hydrolase-like protein [Kineococcus sp. TRM81007]
MLRDGFALTFAGEPAPFRRVAEGVLRAELGAAGVRERLERDLDDAVEFALGAFSEFTVHPDVPDGVHRLAAEGFALVALTNGSAAECEGLLERAGLRSRFGHVLSVQDAGPWKPHPDAYAHALSVCGLAADESLLAAVHPWDVDGAARAGLRTAWVDRAGAPYPSTHRGPDLVVPGVDALADTLAGTSPTLS